MNIYDKIEKQQSIASMRLEREANEFLVAGFCLDDLIIVQAPTVNTTGEMMWNWHKSVSVKWHFGKLAKLSKSGLDCAAYGHDYGPTFRGGYISALREVRVRIRHHNAKNIVLTAPHPVRSARVIGESVPLDWLIVLDE